MKIQLRAVDAQGFATNVTLTPWSVAIPHEEVNFASGSAVIEAGERPKLDEAYAKIFAAATKAQPFVKCLLFIAGHTDTVGTRESNHRLSVDRARAIAVYFRQKGIKIPISYEGFGEDLPRVKTPDETAERANRRADYVLSAEEPLSKAPAEWKAVQ
jgi:outer membrane protein OmpA-like peptidoglycan-associated protein